MPGRDGTGPLGKGPTAGQGAGGGIGQGGRGRMKGHFAAGLGGQCICPSCDYKTGHTAGQPCSEIKCPKCGATLIRG